MMRVPRARQSKNGSSLRRTRETRAGLGNTPTANKKSVHLRRNFEQPWMLSDPYFRPPWYRGAGGVQTRRAQLLSMSLT